MTKKLYRLHNPFRNIRSLYDGFDTPICSIDCGEKCAVHNPNGKPFCCDICQAVPAVYQDEWKYLQTETGLWRAWQGNECSDDTQAGAEKLLSETPDNMLLLACLGPQHCERPFRSLSCRQFPFFPYVTADYRFVGMAYDWDFEQTCWVISNLDGVTEEYRQQFIEVHDQVFAYSQEIFDSYQAHSERAREHFAMQRRRIPLLHRNGGNYLVSPGSERMQKVEAGQLIKFGPYRG